jgi:hypothetical protein
LPPAHCGRPIRRMVAVKWGRKVLVASTVSMWTGLSVITACSSNTGSAPTYAATKGEPSPFAVPDADACTQCTESACSRERARCNASPECASGPGIPGIPSDAAQGATATEPTAARRELLACLDRASLNCGACRTASATFRSPLLTQTCQDASTLEYDAGTSQCDACIDQRCCESAAANDSYPDAERTALRACFIECVGKPAAQLEACKLDCFQPYPRAQVEARLQMLQCANFRCVSECGVKRDCSGDCIRTSCADVTAACFGNIECHLLSDCVEACTAGLDCVNACSGKYPGARSLLAQATGCLLGYCSRCQ